jgi:hypothetical protein
VLHAGEPTDETQVRPRDGEIQLHDARLHGLDEPALGPHVEAADLAREHPLQAAAVARGGRFGVKLESAGAKIADTESRGQVIGVRPVQVELEARVARIGEIVHGGARVERDLADTPGEFSLEAAPGEQGRDRTGASVHVEGCVVGTTKTGEKQHSVGTAPLRQAVEAHLERLREARTSEDQAGAGQLDALDDHRRVLRPGKRLLVPGKAEVPVVLAGSTALQREIDFLDRQSPDQNRSANERTGLDLDQHAPGD